jgi:hypothetical protein
LKIVLDILISKVYISININTNRPGGTGRRRSNMEQHVFEKSGLGHAPFRFLGVYELPSASLAETNPSAYNAALAEMPPGFHCGTCAYCGMPLKYNYLIKSSDSRTFSVGCECVNKTHDGGLVKKVKSSRLRIDREKRATRRSEQHKAYAAKKIEEIEARVAAERKRNGGMTDAELAYQKRDEEFCRRQVVLAPLADRLEDGRGGFCDSVAASLRNGDLPKGRGLDIMLDILAKQAGRRGSKAYEEEMTKLEDDIRTVSGEGGEDGNEKSACHMDK